MVNRKGNIGMKTKKVEEKNSKKKDRKKVRNETKKCVTVIDVRNGLDDPSTNP